MPSLKEGGREGPRQPISSVGHPSFTPNSRSYPKPASSAGSVTTNFSVHSGGTRPEVGVGVKRVGVGVAGSPVGTAPGGAGKVGVGVPGNVGVGVRADVAVGVTAGVPGGVAEGVGVEVGTVVGVALLTVGV